ncbi:MAG: hypothetical protein WAW61_13030 [Methylococcaceae bacterium]
MNQTNTNTPEPPELKSRLCDLSEAMDNEIRALQAFSSLLSGSHDPGVIDIAELPYLVDPIIERLDAIQNEISEVFYSGDLVAVNKGGHKAQ